ncbi:MAG TPA: VOC family protein [Chloroflexota bacterium]|nr:VOC family protein [Chloroflexota bacterium]
MTIRRLDHVAITVRDLDRSIAFYARHFGLDPYFVERDRPRGPRAIAYLRSSQGVLELTHDPDRALGAGFHFCFVSDDFDADVARLVAEGVAVKAPPHPTAAREPSEQHWLRTVFSGPDGEEIEVRGPSHEVVT